MRQVPRAGAATRIEMADASSAGVALGAAVQAYSHVARRFEEKDWIDIATLNLPQPTALRRQIDYRALLKSAEWYLEPLRQGQPRSFAAFFERGRPELVVLEAVWDDVQFGRLNIWDLYINTHGRLIQLAVGDGEEGYGERMQFDGWLSLPGQLARSWLWRATGWRLPRVVPCPPMVHRQMIRTTTEGLDAVLESFNLTPKVAKQLQQPYLDRFPDIAPSRKGGRIEFRCFLDTRPMGVSGPVGDQFFTRSRMRDGTVYHIRNGDAGNLHVLERAAEAIDFYHEHLLLKRAGEFNFSPWSRPL